MSGTADLERQQIPQPDVLSYPALDRVVIDKAMALLSPEVLLWALEMEQRRIQKGFDDKLRAADSLGITQKVATPPSKSTIQRAIVVLSEFTKEQQLREESVRRLTYTYDWFNGLPAEVVAQSREAALVYQQFNLDPFGGDEEKAVENTCLNIIYNSGVVTFPILSCPILQADLLRGDDSSYYVAKYADGNTVLTTSKRTTDFTTALRRIGLRPKPVILFMDRDEEDYIWPVLSKPIGIDDQIVSQQRLSQRQNLRTNLMKAWKTTDVEVLSWGDEVLPAYNQSVGQTPLYDEIIRTVLERYYPEEAEAELRFMTDSMQDWYRGVLGTPTSAEIQDIVNLKFSAYAYQGYILERYFRGKYPILLQNETPSLLRTKMINLLQTDKIPALYPYSYK